MKRPRRTSDHHAHAFTLVELLVVMAIIALLVGILVPAISAVRTAAKVTAGQAQLAALDQGLDMFRNEQSLGGAYPPSSSDDDDRTQIIDPLVDGATEIDVTGGHLLVHAMLGADLLGPPGFVDIDGNNTWSDDTGRGPGGAYELSPTTAEPLRRRFEAGFVDDKMRGTVKTLRSLLDTGKMVNIDSQYTGGSTIGGTLGQYLFSDPWDRPVLYYRANRAARLVTGDAGGSSSAPPIYRQEDNAVITGSNASGLLRTGADFGTGIPSGRNFVHPLGLPTSAVPLPVTIDSASGLNQIYTQPVYEDTFTRFILDPNSQGRNVPVRKDGYLLISAGPDALYGTEDDITNWKRTRE